MLRLSIIIPFYNVEQYIEQCIRSMYEQNIPLSEYEVVCVDDCSPDGSRRIVERLQKDYSNLRLVINEENRKLGGARNAGIVVAQGKYIWFVDSDDYIAPNCFKTIIQEMESNNLELLHFDDCEFNNKITRLSCKPYSDDAVVTGTEFVLDQSHGVWSSRCPVAWNKVICKDFLTRNNLRFVEKMMFEDTDWSLTMFPLVKRMKHLDMICYYHRVNPQSITHVGNTGQIMYYKIMQQYRCVRAYKMASNDDYKVLVRTYISKELTGYRNEIKSLSNVELKKYRSMIFRQNISYLHFFCNWRTWFAIKYGIIRFVK